MKRIVIICCVLFAACASTQGLNYTYVGPSGGFWDVAANWDNGSGGSIDFPNAADAVVVVNNGNSVEIDQSRIASVTLQSLTTSGGSTLLTDASSEGGLKIYAGDVSLGALWNPDGVEKGTEMHVSGDFGCYQMGTGGPDGRKVHIIMTSTGKTYTISGATHATRYAFTYLTVDGGSVQDGGSQQSIYDGSYQNTTITLKNGAYLNGGTFEAREIVLESANATPIQNGTNIHYVMSIGGGDHNTTRLALGGINYPGNVQFQTCSGTAAGYLFTYNFKGGTAATTTIAGDLYIGNSKDSANLRQMTVETVDCNTGNSIDIHVGGDLYVGRQGARISYSGTNYPTPTSGTAAIRGLLVLGSSELDVDGKVQVGYPYSSGHAAYAGRSNVPSGSMHLDSSTVRVGGNWSVFRFEAPYESDSDFVIANWDAGTSTVIFDGDGGSPTQVVDPWGTWFHNMTVDTTGAVQLGHPDSGDLTLTGGLNIAAGTFDPNGRSITFNGGQPEGSAQEIFHHDGSSSIGDVLIAEGSDTYVKLMSDLTMDNLVMEANTFLLLNGYTLEIIDDATLESAGIGEMSWGDGTIIGTAAIPEPATLLLVGTGVLGALGWMRRRRMG